MTSMVYGQFYCRFRWEEGKSTAPPPPSSRSQIAPGVYSCKSKCVHWKSRTTPHLSQSHFSPAAAMVQLAFHPTYGTRCLRLAECAPGWHNRGYTCLFVDKITRVLSCWRRVVPFRKTHRRVLFRTFPTKFGNASRIDVLSIYPRRFVTPHAEHSSGCRSRL